MSYVRNGEYWGVAFSDPELCMSDLYPAVAAIYKDDAFLLRLPCPED